MTQDTNPTLTEDGVALKSQIRFVIHASSHIIINSNANFDTVDEEEIESRTKKLEQQILTALEQYPKLKEENTKLIYAKNLFAEENQKLKAENEELKKDVKLGNEIAFKYAELFKENNQLKQLKQRVEKFVDEELKYVVENLKHPNFVNESKLLGGRYILENIQQLLKDDTK